MPRRRRLATAAVVLALAGCQSTPPTLGPIPSGAGVLPSAAAAETSGAASTGGPPADLDALVPPGTFTAAASPLDVTVETDDQRAASADIGYAGGTVTATGADGSTYTLTIPRGSVWPPTTISLTPITSLTAETHHVGGNEVLGAVMEPSGLELLSPATLVIKPATDLDHSLFFWFRFHDRGADASLALADQSTGLALPIDHFSGAGIVHRAPSAPADDEGAQVELAFDQIVSSMARDRLDGMVARSFGAERNATLLGQDPPKTTPQQVLEAAQWRYLKEVIGPLLQVAGNPAATCDDASALVAAINGAERQRGLLGLATPEADTALEQAYAAVMEKAIPLVQAACRRDAARKCRETGEIQDTVRRALSEGHMMALLGGEVEAPIPDFYQRILTWCAVYELTFVSNIQIKTSEYRISGRIEGHLTLRLAEPYVDPSQWPPDIEGRTEGGLNPFLTSVTCSASAAEMVCAPGAEGRQPTSARITQLEFGGQARQVVNGQVSLVNVPPNFELSFRASAMVLPFVVKGPGGQISSQLEIYATTFNTAHEPDGSGGFITVRSWQRGGYPLLWKKAYADQRTKEKALFNDSTLFELTHKPDPEPAA